MDSFFPLFIMSTTSSHLIVGKLDGFRYYQNGMKKSLKDWAVIYMVYSIGLPTPLNGTEVIFKIRSWNGCFLSCLNDTDCYDFALVRK